MVPLTIECALEEGLKRMAVVSESTTSDTLVLLAHALGKEKTWLFAHRDQKLNENEQERWQAALDTYAMGVPLPYVIGEWEFYGLKLKVTPAVLIPRPETELLVESGLRWLGAHPGRRRALDVGTGSGCIAVALAANVPDLRLTATEISHEALEVARANIERYQLSQRVNLVETNLMDGIQEPFDLISSNLPYIPDERLPYLEVSRWEPGVALGGGPDGLRFIQPFLEQAATRLSPRGVVLAEIDAPLEDPVQKLAGSHWPGAHIAVRKDLAGLPRLLVVDNDP
ncbi:MAG TPA: peptide chain release factor N(5)-glutamine methyltransferase [Anaerolineales bacterium]|nr:peptide chain release factor N(5)-glutamine methyltransferase [Anaerolineales bacterium]